MVLLRFDAGFRESNRSYGNFFGGSALDALVRCVCIELIDVPHHGFLIAFVSGVAK